MKREVPVHDATVEVDGTEVRVSAGDTELVREFDHPAIDISVEDGQVVISTDSDKRDLGAIVGTYAAHIKNMINGVAHGFEYRMEGFYAHFPMDMVAQGDTFVIKNFIGERADRHIDIPDGVDVTVDDEDVILTGPDKEQVSQTAANIEQACHKGKRDPRKFQDGIYITGKAVMNDE